MTDSLIETCYLPAALEELNSERQWTRSESRLLQRTRQQLHIALGGLGMEPSTFSLIQPIIRINSRSYQPL